MNGSKEIWRYRCPRGHSSWHTRNKEGGRGENEYYCRTCERNDLDPHFDELRDMKDESSRTARGKV